MSGRIVYLNGEFVPEDQARISIFDSALIIGDMAFESTRTFRGEPFELGTHLDRLFGTLEILKVDCGLTQEELEAITRETYAQNRETEPAAMEWQIVHNISPGPGALYRPAFSDEELRPTVCINCWPMIPQLAAMAPLYEQGVRLVIPEQRAMPPSLINPRAKTRSRVHAKLAQLEAEAIDPGSWPLLLDVEGYLAEGPSWNVFLVRDGRLLTPSTRNVLPGVSRTITLNLARELGIPTKEADLTPHDARTAEEMFCTATSFCVLAVRAFEGHALGKALPGPVTRRLIDAWKKQVGVGFIEQSQQFARDLPAWLAKEREPRKN